jgi:hypothetical protein
MEMTIIASPETADALATADRSNRSVAQIVSALEKLGLQIRRQFPRVTDPELKRYFITEVPDAAHAEKAAAVLRNCSGIEAAYWKPPDELPS